MYGSVRGVLGNRHTYRDTFSNFENQSVPLLVPSMKTSSVMFICQTASSWRTGSPPPHHLHARQRLQYCPLYLWQAPLSLDFAKPRKHLFVLFSNSCSFRLAEKLDHVSMGASQYDKRVQATG